MPNPSQTRTRRQPDAPVDAAAGSGPTAGRATKVRQPKPAPRKPASVQAEAVPASKPKGRVKAATAPVVAPIAAPARASKKTAKPRPVLVRDSFTMPEADFALIAKLKATALEGQRAAKKSELLRAGLQLLAGLDTESLVAVLNRLETVKTGRPKKGH